MYLTEYNTRCYGVTFQNDECVKVQKFEVFPDYEKNKSCVKPLRTTLGKTKICEKTNNIGSLW